MWFFRTLSAIICLLSIIFTIPLAFDVGGRNCGLAFSLTLSSFYFLYSTLRLVTPAKSRLRKTLVRAIAVLQVLVLPALLIWSLSRFSIDADVDSGWVERTMNGSRTSSSGWTTRIFGSQGWFETASLYSWDKLLRWSTPVFQLTEGFCSLLVIQAVGQVTKYLVNNQGGDSWMVSRAESDFSSHSINLANRLVYSSRPHRPFPLLYTFCGVSLPFLVWTASTQSSSAA